MNSRIKNLTTEHTGRSVLTIKLAKVSSGWEHWFLLRTDAHWDNPKSDRALQKKHLDQAVERKAGVLDFGDFFCAMQGRHDKRGTKDDVRPEHRHGNYLDSLVDTAIEWHKPYAHNIMLLGMGNHESSIKKHQETDLTERLAQGLKTATGAKILAGPYSGWVRFLFLTARGTESKTLAFHHGFGGGGVAQTTRMASYLPDADIVVTGHNHTEYYIPIERARLSVKGTVFLDEQLHIKVPGYKEEYEDGFGGWHIETGKPPKPTGAVWLKFSYLNHKIIIETYRAK